MLNPPTREGNSSQEGEEELPKTGEQTVYLLDESLKRLKGFIQIPKFIILHRKLSYGAKVAYGILLTYAWQDDFCYPAQESLARDMGCSVRNVRRFLNELKDQQLVNWKQRGLNRPNTYYILPLPTKDDDEDPGNPGGPPDVNNPLTSGKDKTNKNKDGTNLSHPDRTDMSHQDRTRESDYLESNDLDINNVNVTPVSQKSAKTVDNSNALNAFKKSSSKANDEIDFLVMDIMEICPDKHSKGFYTLVAQKCPREMIYTALSEVKDLKLTGQLKKTPGAAFTKIIKEKTKRADIDLGLKK